MLVGQNVRRAFRGVDQNSGSTQGRQDLLEVAPIEAGLVGDLGKGQGRLPLEFAKEPAAIRHGDHAEDRRPGRHLHEVRHELAHLLLVHPFPSSFGSRVHRSRETSLKIAMEATSRTIVHDDSTRVPWSPTASAAKPASRAPIGPPPVNPTW